MHAPNSFGVLVTSTGHRRGCLTYSSAVNQPTHQGKTYAHGGAIDNNFRTDVQPDLLTQKHFQPDAFASSMSNDFGTEETPLSEAVPTFHEEDSIMSDRYISDSESSFGSSSYRSTSSVESELSDSDLRILGESPNIVGHSPTIVSRAQHLAANFILNSEPSKQGHSHTMTGQYLEFLDERGEVRQM